LTNIEIPAIFLSGVSFIAKETELVTHMGLVRLL
jgi:hypothetical protein